MGESVRYAMLMKQYNELSDAALAVLEATDKKLENEDPPFKWVSAWAALTKLSEVLAKHGGAR